MLPCPLASALLLLTGGRPPIDGQTLDPQLALILWANDRLGLHGLRDDGVDAARARFRTNARLFIPRRRLAASRDLTVQGAAGPLRARLYTPRRASGAGMVWFHGGGWVVGDLDTHDAVCARLSSDAGVTIVAVDYRLAPEHPFPAPVEDAWAAFQDVVRRAGELGLDPARIAVGGDSAGGNLSAAVSLLARDAGGPAPAAQLLVYPGLDLTRTSRSEELFGKGFLLTSDDIAWFKRHYLPSPEASRDWRASPLLAPDLRGVPRALIVAAAFDPLRDDALDYAARLREAGVPVESRCEPGLVHGFLHLTTAVRSASRAAGVLAADLRRALVG